MAAGVLVHDEKEEPPEDDVEIVIKPFRTHGPYSWPPSQEEVNKEDVDVFVRRCNYS